MGELEVNPKTDELVAQLFMKRLLADLAALEHMLANGKIDGVRRMGAEQEMFLVDGEMHPAPIAEELLLLANDDRLTTEIGRFNLEANLSPRLLGGRSFRAMEEELQAILQVARESANQLGVDVLLAGILPTVSRSDLRLENMTRRPRYDALNRAATQMRGGSFFVHLKGLDELQMTHDNILLEACCTSFQVHLQVSPEEFARHYNVAQLITAPLLAAAANSPVLFGHRLWHETRIALFQQSVDERSSTRQTRHHPTRVSFGEEWVKSSVMEIYRDQVARFRLLLTKQVDEDPMEVLQRGGLPELFALRLHNGTVWRWNRPCYGVTDGEAHLRIENRVLPSGPSVLDEIANAAFFIGLMIAVPETYGRVDQLMAFDDAKDNFLTAARRGLKAQFAWLSGERISAPALIIDHLLPLARQGLKDAAIASEDIDRYLGTIEERVRRDQTGALWALRSLAHMGENGRREGRYHRLTAKILEGQKLGLPIHQWELAKFDDDGEWGSLYQTVEQFMTTDLFTVGPDDLVDFAASIMHWRHIRHLPVEDPEGHLIGVVTHRALLRLFASGAGDRRTLTITVRDVMRENPIIVEPRTPTLEALNIMQTQGIGCLPVVDNGRLVGIITAHDFLSLSSNLMKEHLNNSRRQRPISQGHA
jgi:CBS domain-containing protein